MKTIFKYGIIAFFVVAIAIAGIAIDNALSSKAEIVQQDVAINEKVEITQAAIDQAAASGYKDVSEAVKDIGVTTLERRAFMAEEQKQRNYIRQLNTMNNIDAMIKVNECFASVLANKAEPIKEPIQEPVPGEPLKAG